jgi:trehalose 6-phosphate phosphatase
MKPLLFEAGQAALRGFLVKPVLCLFDFDGTLAPLISDPALVNLSPEMQQQLQALQRRTPIGIITGRSLADIQKRLRFEPDHLIGNHGTEGLPGWDRQAPANFALCRTWLSLLQPLLSPFGDAVWLEDKSYSLTVHYRHPFGLLCQIVSIAAHYFWKIQCQSAASQCRRQRNCGKAITSSVANTPSAIRW